MEHLARAGNLPIGIVALNFRDLPGNDRTNQLSCGNENASGGYLRHGIAYSLGAGQLMGVRYLGTRLAAMRSRPSARMTTAACTGTSVADPK
jgi:hypothetical protein